jgi:hypothetical protein
MKKAPIIFVLFLFNMAVSIAQGPPIGAIRSLDNNQALAEDSTDWKLHRAIKEIPLQRGNPGISVSFGGEVREQLRYYNHVNFGDVDSGVSDRDLYLQQRYMLHTNIQVHRFLRFFVQFNSCRATGKNTETPQTDRDDLGVMQVFADLNMHVPSALRLRLGRQEFLYGQDRMLGLRDGPTVRQTFDGARLTLATKKVAGDLFFVVPVSYEPGIFDNTWRTHEYVLASYWILPLPKDRALDFYYFGVQFHNSTYANDTADENRHSLGIRLSKGSGSFTYDAEFTCQFGQFGQQDIRAWQLASQISYSWQQYWWRPRLSVREGLYSGDREPADGTINTFRPVSTKSPVHDMIGAGSANLLILAPEAEITLSSKLVFTMRYMAFWRLSGNDGVYPPDVRKMLRGTDVSGAELGKEISRGATAEFMYTPNKHVVIWIYYGYLLAGEYIRNTGSGRNMEAFSLRAAYKF